MRRVLGSIMTVVLIFAACKSGQPEPTKQGSDGVASGVTTPEPVAVPAAPSVDATAPTPTDERTEPAASPARQSLELLVSRGSGDIKSIRQERKGIFQLFLTVSDDLKKEVSPLITETQRNQWDERPEKLRETPAHIHGVIQQILPISEKIRQTGEAGLNSMKTMNEENTAAKRAKHREDKIDKLHRQSSEEVKVARNLMLLVRSLLDEARIYAEFGSLEMREDMRKLFSPFKTTDGWPHEQAQKSLDRLLYELNVPGVVLPSLD